MPAYWFVITLLAFAGCRAYTPENLPEERLHFGSGGGVTGEVREYILLPPSGRILFRDSRDNTTLTDLGKLTATERSEIYVLLERIDFEKATGCASCNVTSFLAYHGPEGANQRLQWAAGSPPDEAIDRLYDQLMAGVRNLRERN